MWTDNASTLECSPADSPAEFVPVAIAGDIAQAQEMRVLLESQNVPTLIDDDQGSAALYATLMRGIPVLVPTQMHDVASDILSSHQRSTDYPHSFSDGDEEEEDVDLVDDDDEDDDDYDDDDFDDLDDDYDDDDFDEDEDEDDFD